MIRLSIAPAPSLWKRAYTEADRDESAATRTGPAEFGQNAAALPIHRQCAAPPIDNPSPRRSDPGTDLRREGKVAKFRIATPAGASFTVAGADYGYEMEALAPIDAELYEVPAGSEDEFIAAARDADALYAKGRPITRRMIDGLARCKIIALGSVGVDSVDVDAATAKGIPVTNCPDTFIEEVADHAMRLILATHGRLVVQDRLVREGRWAEGRPMLLQVPRLRGLTLGLVAFGHVARAVAERAKPFGLQIIAYDPFIEEIVMVERGVEPVSLPELLARADIISMHSPATASANRMIREEHFRQMKKSAIYISTGRGPTTDEAALIKALDEGMIAAAGLDVLEKEPPGGNNPLLTMDNVILTAHVASATSRFDPARRRRVGQELALVLTGRWPMSCVNPSVLAASGLRRWQPVSMERGPNS
jgi:D-3-phosphoglycerate dehydrogenase / 2-oxoglutarate reductase